MEIPKHIDKAIEGFVSYLNDEMQAGNIDSVIILVGKTTGDEEITGLETDTTFQLLGEGTDITRALAAAMMENDFNDLVNDASDINYLESRAKTNESEGGEHA